MSFLSRSLRGTLYTFPSLLPTATSALRCSPTRLLLHRGGMQELRIVYSLRAGIHQRLHLTTHPLEPNARPLASYKMPLLADAADDADTLVVPRFQRQVSYWLLACSGLVFGIIALGGYTRLSGSGLSMTNWKLSGSRMPSSREEWEKEFDRYKEFPEYALSNYGMTVEEFRRIYFVEWLHRMVGRGIGVVFAAGGIYFGARRALKLPFVKRVGALFSLGGLQGLVGWWMVKSGLEQPQKPSDRARVSPYRLTAHLLAALTLYCGLIWNAFTLLRPPPAQLHSTLTAVLASKSFRKLAVPLSAIVATTILSGAFVAGNDAGRAYNTWPKMNDEWVPFQFRSLWESKKDLFENTAVVQFNHRMLAYTTVLSTLALYVASRCYPVSAAVKKASMLVPMAATLQMLIGITTLLTLVPTELGVTHQVGAVALLTAITYLLHSLRLPVRFVK